MDNEKEIEGQATETEQEEQATGSNQNKQQATFTQEQVNKVVAKEKAAWRKQVERLGADHETIVAEKDKAIQRRDEVIQAQVDLLKKDLELDEITLELLAEKDPLEQFNTLVKIMEKKGKQDIPRTPQGSKKQTEFQSSFRPRI